MRAQSGDHQGAAVQMSARGPSGRVPTPFSWPLKRACLSSPHLFPEGQALADTTVLQPGSPLLRPLRNLQGFPIPARPAPEQLMRRGPLSVFYLPASRKEYEVAPGSSLLTPQERSPMC